MIGATLLYCPDPAQLDKVIADLEAIDGLQYVYLDTLLSLDFPDILGGTELIWESGEPYHFDASSGISICLIDPESLRYVVGLRDGLDPLQLDDVSKIRAFTAEHGFDAIYSLETF